MFSLRTHVIITVSLLALLVLVPMMGSALAPGGVETLGGLKTIAQAGYLTLFVLFGLSTIPVIVMLVLGTQVRLGNADKAPVAAALRRQRTIIWIMMGLMAAGAAIAIPAMILDGGLDSTPPAATGTR
ncbi:MAG TPA: hypothetical protein VHL34_15235 [Rhizomicrobium sp.]|nr:hypothetical protein [Rhizomicrobium sp.]